MAADDPAPAADEIEGGTSGDHPTPQTHSFLVGPSTTVEINTIRAAIIPVACWRLDDLRFDFDSSFLRPEAAKELKKLSKLVKDHPDAPLSVFGHADPVGNDDYNKRLSGRRAIAIYALLVREPDRWEKLFKDSEDNWGLKSTQVMLKTLGHDPGNTDGVVTAQHTEAVKAFQRSKDLTDDGDPGPLTRGNLYPDYMDKICIDEAGQPFRLQKTDFLGKGADAGGKADFQGCSEFNPLLMFSQAENQEFQNPAKKAERDSENAPNRRVMVLLFRPGSKVNPSKWPCPRASEGTAGCIKRFWSDSAQRRQFQADRRTFEDDRDTFACRFYHRLTVASPCERVAPPLPPPTIDFVKIETSVFAPAPLIPVFFPDDDFSPRINEHAMIHVRINNLRPGTAATVRVDIGRLTNRADNAATADVNESFTLVARVEQNVVGGANPQVVQIEWDGNATVAVPQEFSNRQTLNTNTAANIDIPLQSIAAGQPVIHGLYVIDEISLRQAAAVVHKVRPVNVDMSVPILVNLIFNGNWAGDLNTFGLAPFQSTIEDALRRFGGRDYMIRDANVLNRINARYITDPAVNNTQSMRVSVGGLGTGPFGSTPNGPAPLSENIYTFHEGISADVVVFPRRFIVFNTPAGAIGPGDQATFQATYGPVGVAAGATPAAPGVATPRTVAGGVVTGACNAVDVANTTVTLDNDGLATVVTTNPALVPAARATDIQRALRAFVRMIGNTINHEVGHALGLVTRILANNQLTINGVTVTSPQNGDGGGHNRVTNTTNILDAGNTRAFVRRIENTGIQQVFNAANLRLMRDCIPFDRRDD